MVTGQVDWAALDDLTGAFLATRLRRHGHTPATIAPSNAAGSNAAGSNAAGSNAAANPAAGAGMLLPAMPVPGMPPACVPAPGGSPEAPPAPRSGGCCCGETTDGGCCGCDPGQALAPASWARLERALLGLAADVMSGPAGLAARLRAGLGGGLVSSASLLLDVGAATETIPAHLRRAAILRHPHCGFPGCQQPASTCQIHHLIPRSRGGPTALWNLLPLCAFHHLAAVHRWGWTPPGSPPRSAPTGNPPCTATAHPPAT